MAEILWDKKVGTYDRINSDYLTPEPHAHNIQMDLEIEVYLITYDWGNQGMSHEDANSNVMEFTYPYYIGNLEGQVTSEPRVLFLLFLMKTVSLLLMQTTVFFGSTFGLGL